MYYERVTRQLVPHQLFNQLFSIMLTGTVDSIESDLFSVEFTHMNIFILKITNFREFFHKSSHFLASLNARQVHVNTKSIREFQSNAHNLLQTVFVSLSHYMSFERVYTYPDADLCLFKAFPHARLVLAQVYTAKPLNCSCTLKWLHLEQVRHATYIQIGSDYYPEYVDDTGANNLTRALKYCLYQFKKLECDFDTKFSNCHSKKKNQTDLGNAKIIINNANSMH